MNLQGHDVRIEQDNNNITRVLIDGKELKGVRAVDYSNRVHDVPVITIEFMPKSLNKEENKKTTAEITINTDKVAEIVIDSINKKFNLDCTKGVNI